MMGFKMKQIFRVEASLTENEAKPVATVRQREVKVICSAYLALSAALSLKDIKPSVYM